MPIFRRYTFKIVFGDGTELDYPHARFFRRTAAAREALAAVDAQRWIWGMDSTALTKRSVIHAEIIDLKGRA